VFAKLSLHSPFKVLKLNSFRTNSRAGIRAFIQVLPHHVGKAAASSMVCERKTGMRRVYGKRSAASQPSRFLIVLFVQKRAAWAHESDWVFARGRQKTECAGKKLAFHKEIISGRKDNTTYIAIQ
jgi:hypothetical protein